MYAHKCFQNRRCSFILLWFSLKENQNMAKNNIQRRKQLTMDKPHHFIAYGSTYTSWPAGRVLNRHTPPRDNSWEGFTWYFFYSQTLDTKVCILSSYQLTIQNVHSSMPDVNRCARMEDKNNTPYTIEESGTLSHPDAGLNENHLKTAQTEFELGTSWLHPLYHRFTWV